MDRLKQLVWPVGLGVATAMAAAGLRWVADPLLGPRLAFAAIAPAAALTTLAGGWLAGVLCVVLYTLLAVFFFVDPRGTLRFEEGVDLAQIVASASVGLMIVAICAFFRRARERAEEETARAHRTERKLRLVEERFRLATRATSDIIYDWDIPGGRVHFGASTAEVLGYRDGDIEHTLRWWEERMHPDDRDRVVRGLRAAVEGGAERWTDEYRFRRADGTYADIMDRGYAVREPGQGTIRLVGAMADISDRKRHERELAAHATSLERSNRDLEDFAQSISHDLKEPLRGIASVARHLLEDLGEAAPDQRAPLESLVRLPSRMADQLDALLEFSRVGRTEMAMGENDVGEIVRETADQLSGWLEARNAEVVIGPLPKGRCDRLRLAQVFLNLIVNGVKYNESPRKRVEIGVLQNEVEPVLFVRDNGIGIPERSRDAVFGMFKRLHPRDQYEGGAGAGLALCKKIVERHGGHMWLLSPPPGRPSGTEVRFTIQPSAPHEFLPLERAAVPAAEQLSDSGLRGST